MIGKFAFILITLLGVVAAGFARMYSLMIFFIFLLGIAIWRAAQKSKKAV